MGLDSFETNVSETAGQIHLSDIVCDVRGITIGSIMCDVRCIKRVRNVEVKSLVFDGTPALPGY